MTKYCVSCEKDVEAHIIQKEEFIDLRGKSFKINSKIYKCPICEAELWDDEESDNTLRAAYTKYRKENKLLLPEEIKQIRMKYDLTQVAFSRILGFGDKTITRYENGALQDKAQNNLLILVRDIKNFLTLWSANKNNLTAAEIQKTEKWIKENCSNQIPKKQNIIYHHFNGSDSWNDLAVNGGIQ